jgi:hypothetical protein
MLAYKIKSRIDKKGNLSLYNLPFKDKDPVEIIIFFDDNKMGKADIGKNVDLLKALFGAISSPANLVDNMIKRENLYGNDGR